MKAHLILRKELLGDFELLQTFPAAFAHRILDPLRRPGATTRPCLAAHMIFEFCAGRFALLIRISAGGGFARFLARFRKNIAEIKTECLELFFNFNPEPFLPWDAARLAETTGCGNF